MCWDSDSVLHLFQKHVYYFTVNVLFFELFDAAVWLFPPGTEVNKGYSSLLSYWEHACICMRTC